MVKTNKKGAKAQAASGTVRVATVSLPGSPARSYIVGPDDDADTSFVPYKKEMGIRTTSHEPKVVFQDMPAEDFQLLYDEQRAFVKRFGTPAVGNIAMTGQPAAIDRALTDEQKEVLEEDDELGVVSVKGRNTTPLSDREDAEDDDEEEGTSASALAAKTPQAEEEDDTEEVEVSRDEVKEMSKTDLQELARGLSIKGYKTMKVGKLRKAVLDKLPEEEEEEEEEEEDE